jgi:hypothetical protein
MTPEVSARSVQKETAVASYWVSSSGMTRKEAKKLDEPTLAIVKEMAQPRFAKSARAAEEKANHLVTVRLKPAFVKTPHGKLSPSTGRGAI